MMYLADDNDLKTIYIFATKGGSPTNPDWYYNLTNAGLARVELGTETYDVTVSEITPVIKDTLWYFQHHPEVDLTGLEILVTSGLAQV
jgi:hypothetical protein